MGAGDKAGGGLSSARPRRSTFFGLAREGGFSRFRERAALGGHRKTTLKKRAQLRGVSREPDGRAASKLRQRASSSAGRGHASLRRYWRYPS